MGKPLETGVCFHWTNKDDTIPAAFIGDLKDRHQVADFYLELVNWLF